jgi:hypothetical protein
MISLPTDERRDEMPKTITEQNVTHSGLDMYCVEASDLGLKPGEWPNELPTTMGNKQPFVKDGPMYSGTDDDPELVGVNYHQLGGCITLKVWND